MRHVVAFGLVLVLVCATARADDAAEQEARKLFKEGIALLEQGELATAHERFVGAYALWQHPKILLNIATTLRNLGRTAEAANAYERYLRDPGADSERRVEVAEILTELDAKVARINIRTSQPDARVTVDGRPLDGPLELLRAEPGAHTIVAQKNGFVTAVEAITVAAGERRELLLELIVAPPPPPPTPTPTVPPPPPPTARPTATVDTPPPPVPASLSHASQIGAHARAEIDGKFRGVVAAVGASYGIGDYFEVQLSGLLGHDKGIEPGAYVFILHEMLKPAVYVGMPIFFVDGARPGLHAAGGLQVDPIAHFGLIAQLGFAVFASTPAENYEQIVFVPAIGAQARY